MTPLPVETDALLDAAAYRRGLCGSSCAFETLEDAVAEVTEPGRAAAVAVRRLTVACERHGVKSVSFQVRR